MRQAVTIGAATLMALLGAMDVFRGARLVKDDYQMEARLARYAAVPAALPDNVREVGYLTDAPYGSGTGGQLLFFTAQYALAPRLVVDKTDATEWVLGNFKQPPADWARAAAENRLRLERDLGNGVALLRRVR